MKHRKRTPANAGRLKLLRELFEIDRGELLLAVIETIIFYSNCRADARVVVPEKIREASKQTKDVAAEFIDAIPRQTPKGEHREHPCAARRA